MNKRINSLKRLLRRSNLDAILISNPSNIYYLTGLNANDTYCLITPSAEYILTDFRYEEQAAKEAPEFKIISSSMSLINKSCRLIKKNSLKRIGFESSHLTVRQAKEISDRIARRLYPIPQAIEKMRIIKDLSELKLIREACCIAKGVLKRIIKEIKNGDREKDVAASIDFLLKTKGADGPCFDTIVASGAHASMPHARPTSKKIREGEAIILDLGAKFNGYTSDLTRTHFVGKIDKHFKLIYSIVAAAQAKAIARIRPGRKISDIDRAGRDYIVKKGFGRCFGHAMGHSMGIDVHEPPAISPKNHTLLKEGMVFSIEPGIYIPGWGGVRIEDTVSVTATGHRVLTR